MVTGLVLFFIGQILGWFQLNTQYLNKWWEDRPLVSAICFGIPTSMFFWYAWRVTSEACGSVWSARFLGSVIGFIVFPILTWWFLNETMFTFKTMSCLFLTFLIVFIQIYFK